MTKNVNQSTLYMSVKNYYFCGPANGWQLWRIQPYLKHDNEK